jgi:hypothetical protein
MPPNSDPLRVVLFGMPDAGKTSLLGALAQAADTQTRALQGKLTDESHGLDELRERVYEQRPRETLQEIVPYPVRYEPNAVAGGPPGPQEAQLIDCDGRAANALLSGDKSLDGSGLAQAVVAADALVLVVDASHPEHRESDFAAFGQFLEVLEHSRARRSAVGGLPVFLVLSKCDLLAGPGATPAEWQARLADQRRAVEERFRDFLAKLEERDGPLFGRLDLRVETTAVHRPELAGSPAQPTEPFGVAEFFRRAFAAAADFRARTRQSQRRLAWTAAGVGAVVCGMAGLAALLLVLRPQTTSSPLTGKIDAYRSGEGLTPSTRLTEPLQRKLAQLLEFQKDPDFARLPAADRQFVESRLEELGDYQQYRDHLTALPTPAETRSRQELESLQQRLLAEVPPPRYQSQWDETEAVQQRARWLEEILALQKALPVIEQWYRDDLIAPGRQLLLFSSPAGSPVAVVWPTWLGQVNDLLAKPPPFPADARLAGPRALTGLTYRALDNFAGIRAAKVEWEDVRGKLMRLRDLSTALGLTGVADARRTPLRIAAPLVDLAQADELAKQLKQTYEQAGDWSLADVAEAPRPQVAAAAAASYRNILDVARAAVLRQLRLRGGETPAHWREVADWLTATPELRGWRELATVLRKLKDDTPEVADPAEELARFLRRDRFEQTLTRLELTLPEDVRLPGDGRRQRLTPAGPLTIRHKGGGSDQALPFAVQGNAKADAARRVVTYLFLPEAGAVVRFTPGDEVSADLPVRDETGRAWRLTWAVCRSPLYMFERLSREPIVHPPELVVSEETGRRVPEAALTALGGGIPAVPDLLPDVSR